MRARCSAAYRPGNAIDRIFDSTLAIGGLDDQDIRDVLGRLTWQICNSNKLSVYFDEVDKYRGHDMQSNEDPETASLRWFSPAYHTAAIKYTSTLSNAVLFEAGYSRNLEYYTNSYQEGVEQQRFTPEWFAGASVPDSVIIRNTPLVYGERLNRDLGLYLQDAWRLNRLTVNAGLRWENIKAQVLASESPAGRFVPARRFEAIQNLPNWHDWAPRFSAVLDVFGTGKTALKYSVNRYNQIRTTGIAGNYNPLLSQTATLPWRDSNANDIAEGERGCTGYPRVGCEIDFTTLSSNFGIAALNEFGDYPRTWNLENAFELQQEVLPGLSLSTAFFHGGFRNLTTTINQSWSLADYTPFNFFNPLTGAPIEVFARSVAATQRPTRNLDTFDPERKRSYNAFQLNSTWRIPGGGQLFGGYTMERERQKACTAPDDPNYLATGSTTSYTTRAFCDDFAGDIPWKHQFKLSGTRNIGFGFELSMALQSNQSPNSSRTMTVTRGVTRYPANCAAPCPAGQIIMPTGTFGQGSLVVFLEPERGTFVERINQLDFKLSRRFQVGRFSLLPVLEVFNLNNSDAIISYVTTDSLSERFLAPNSIMQGRMIGAGLTTRW